MDSNTDIELDEEYQLLLDEFDQSLTSDLEVISELVSKMHYSGASLEELKTLSFLVHKMRGASGVLKLLEFSAALAVLEVQINELLVSSTIPDNNTRLLLTKAFQCACDLLPISFTEKARLSRPDKSIESGAHPRLDKANSMWEEQSRPRILIIEDDEICLNFLKKVLSSENGQMMLEIENNLESGLIKLREYEPDLILLDLNLPDSAGIETFDRVRKVSVSPPVLILTSQTDKQTAIQAVSKGAQDYLSKSKLNADNLLRCIFYAIARNNAQQSVTRINAIKDFISTLSHDLKLPLEAMDRLHVYLSNQPSLSQDAKDLVELLRSTNTTVVEKLKRLLSLYQLEVEDLKIKPSSIDLKALACECLETIRYKFDAKRITVRLKAPSREIRLESDCELLKKSLFVILDNAAKYSYEDTTTSIHLSVQRNTIYISVLNQGPVIPGDQRKRIFKSFWTSVPGKDYVAQTGLSLYLCNQLISKLGGKIHCQSRQQTTRFTIALPSEECFEESSDVEDSQEIYSIQGSNAIQDPQRQI